MRDTTEFSRVCGRLAVDQLASRHLISCPLCERVSPTLALVRLSDGAAFLRCRRRCAWQAIRTRLGLAPVGRQQSGKYGVGGAQ